MALEVIVLKCAFGPVSFAAPSVFCASFFAGFSGKFIVFQAGVQQKANEHRNGDSSQNRQNRSDVDKDNMGAFVVFDDIRACVQNHAKEAGFIFAAGKIYTDRAESHIVVGIGDRSGLVLIAGVIGDDGLQILKGSRLGENNVIFPVQGQEGM